MAIKLLIAEYISTSYYLTLDSDLILLRSLYVTQLLINSPINNNVLNNKRAIYDLESRLDHHPEWWAGSELILGI